MNITDFESLKKCKNFSIIYKFNKYDNHPLEFVKLTKNYLIVNSPNYKNWRIGKKTINEWLKIGVLEIKEIE